MGVGVGVGWTKGMPSDEPKVGHDSRSLYRARLQLRLL